MAHGTVNGKPLTTNEQENHQQREVEQQEGIREQAETLACKLAQTYEELTRLLERNPGVKRQITEGEAKEDKVYQKLKQRLKMADMAPRCQWVRQDGTSCRSPQMKQHIYCFAHMQMAEARTLLPMLPPPEDANAIQVGLMRIQKAVIEDRISMKKAGLLLYSMQLALTNVGQTTFGQAKDEEMVRGTVSEEEALSNQHSAFSEKQNQHQHQRLFTAKDAEDAKERKQNQHQKPFTTEGAEDAKERKQNQHQKPFTTEGAENAEERKQNQHQRLFTAKDAEDTEKNQGLPVIHGKPGQVNTDDTDFGEAGGEDCGGDVEFVPVSGGYGFERVRLRIDPSVHRAVPPQAVNNQQSAVSNQPNQEPFYQRGHRGHGGREELEANTVVGSVLQTECAAPQK